jgi:hypothetical protein
MLGNQPHGVLAFAMSKSALLLDDLKALGCTSASGSDIVTGFHNADVEVPGCGSMDELIGAWSWVLGGIFNEADITLGVAIAGKLPVLVRLDLEEAKTLCELAESVSVQKRTGKALLLQDLAPALGEQVACRALFAYGATETQAAAVATAASKTISRPLIQIILWPKEGADDQMFGIV